MKKKIYNSLLLGKEVSVTAELPNYYAINGQIYMFAEADTAKLRKIKTIIIFMFFLLKKNSEMNILELIDTEVQFILFENLKNNFWGLFLSRNIILCCILCNTRQFSFGRTCSVILPWSKGNVLSCRILMDSKGQVCFLLADLFALHNKS